MDLKLRGSQINLATREGNNNKGNASNTSSSSNNVASAGIMAVEKLNKKSYRPRSACVGPKKVKHSTGKRPQSADSKFFDDLTESNNLKNKTNFTESKKKYASSTNLLKLLSHEPRSRNWTPTDSDIQSESSIANDKPSTIRFNDSVSKLNKISSKAKTSSDELPSTSEDIKPFSPDSQNVLKLNNGLVNGNKGILKSESRSEMDKNNLKKHQSYASWVNENIKAKNLDLPGRVSFNTSTNDVYEFDCSDYDDATSLDSPKTTIPKPLKNDLFTPISRHDYLDILQNDTETDETDEIFRDIPSKCCPTTTMHCGIAGYNSNEVKARMESKAQEEANKIVEEYKREIEELKRIHSKNPYTTPSVVQSQTTEPFPNFFSNVKSYDTTPGYNPANSTTDELTTTDTASPTSIHSADVGSKDMENIYSKLAEQEKALDIKPLPKDDKETKIESTIPVKLNNAWEKETKLNISFHTNNTSTPKATAASNGHSSVIKNYLNGKGKNDDRPVKSVKKGNETKKTTKTKPKSAAARAKSAPPKTSDMRKSKSIPSLRDDRNIDEFEIDKVVSWMSIHEDNFSDTTSINNFEATAKETTVAAWKKHSKASSGGKQITKIRRELEVKFSTDDNMDTDSPYEEIVSTIKEIERNKEKKENMKSLKEDVEFKLNTILSNIESPDSAISDDDKLDTASSSNSNNKVKEILNYLDEVDKKCDRTLEVVQHGSVDTNSEVDFVYEPDFTEDIPKVSELLMLTNHQLCRKIVNLSLRVNELNNAIQLSKEHVSNVRAEKMKTIRLEKQNTQKRMNEQKKHYEEIVQRHQTFIEQLLKDKAGLCEKVNQLTRRIESQNQAWEHRLKTEIERAKETVIAGEKIRREKWVRDNTKKIKELTVKGLELEINKMNTNHQKEIGELKKQHQKELLDATDELRLKFDEKEKEIRESYAKDREAAIERERLAIVERYEKQINDERKMFEQQKQRFYKELEDEKERIYRESQTQKSQFDASRQKMKSESMDLIHQVKAEFKEKLKQREQKHEHDMKKLEEQFQSDFSVWKREYETTMKLREVERENFIKQQSRIERDRQIDAIVAKVDAEALKNQQEHEMKINRVKEKYEREIKELEKQETESKEKYIEVKTKLAENEANVTNLQATVKTLETQLTHFKKMCDDFIKEKETVKLEAKKEVQNELRNMQRDRETEVARIYARVQKAIDKKDATLEAMQKENNKLKEKCMKLDAIVKQQRKDYCTK